MGGFRHIIEPEPDPEPDRRGKATIIQRGKCKRLHVDAGWLFLAAVAAGGLAMGGAGLAVMALTR